MMNRKTIKFVRIREPLSIGTTHIVGDEAAFDYIASLDFILGYIYLAMCEDLSRTRIFGELGVIKFKGKRKYYVSAVRVHVPYSHIDEKVKTRMGNKLCKEDEMFLYNISCSMLNFIVSRGYKDIQGIKIHFPLSKGIHITVEALGLSCRGLDDYANISMENGKLCTRVGNVFGGIDLVGFYRRIEESGIPVYSITLDKGSKGRVVYSEKFRNHFQIEFV